MPKFTLTRGTHSRYEDDGKLHRYEAGGEIELDEREARRLATRIAAAPSPAALTAGGQFDSDANRAAAPVQPRVAPPPPGTPMPAGASFDLGAVNASQARDHIRTVQDGAALHELRRQEVSGKNRAGVLSDIDARLTEIGDEPPKEVKG